MSKEYSPTIQFFIAKCYGKNQSVLTEYRAAALAFIEDKTSKDPKDATELYFLQLLSVTAGKGGIVSLPNSKNLLNYYEQEAIKYVHQLIPNLPSPAPNLETASPTSIANNSSIFWNRRSLAIGATAISAIALGALYLR